MIKVIYLFLGIVLIGGSIYLFLQKQAPEKYIALVSKNLPIQEEKVTKILFTGDIMLDRAVRQRIDEGGFSYLIEDVKSIFDNKDLVIGNLEGTITRNPSISVLNNKILHFTFATSTAGDLKAVGYDGFSLANNHALDFYQAGFEETQNNLKENNLFSFGHPLNNQNLSYIQKINDESICFVGYHSLYDASTTNVVNEIKNLKARCTFLIVFAHWGIEYEDFETEDQKNEAHEFIDNGANLVIGAHPHVIQPIEIYKNKAIFYSLGNFIFDQDFSMSTRQGIVVEADLSKEQVIYKIIPIEMFKSKLYFPPRESFSKKIDLLTTYLTENFKRSLTEKAELILQR